MPERLIALVMVLYSNARSRVRTLAGTRNEFWIGLGVYQGVSIESLPFVVVMQEATRAARGEGLWNLLELAVRRRHSDDS